MPGQLLHIRYSQGRLYIPYTHLHLLSPSRYRRAPLTSTLSIHHRRAGNGGDRIPKLADMQWADKWQVRRTKSDNRMQSLTSAISRGTFLVGPKYALKQGLSVRELLTTA